MNDFEQKHMEKERIEFTVDSVSPKDASKIQELMQVASRDVYVQGGKSLEEIRMDASKAMSDESIRKIEENISQLTENEKMLVAKVGSNIIGFAYVERGENKNTLQASFVLPEFQGNGIATKLWDSIKGFLNPEFDTYLDVYSTNTNAINFYQKLGFVKTGKIITGRKLEAEEMVLKAKN